MSRSGYTDDYCDDDPLAAGRWRAAVRSSMQGKRGQAFLRELLAALDALPEKELVAKSFVTKGGACCAFGSVAKARGLDVSEFEPDNDDYVNTRGVARAFGVANAMACEIMYMNDDVCGWELSHHFGTAGPKEKPERARWRNVRAWVVSQIND